ncbi:organic hydroperoxide resistance protein [Mucilaginibacter sp. Bleaf8]|uniref:organic hydroperoxide resistance protein n=1 Tax=Mucilaginibacter sp. Bleaf8 TaxID=2834430 RepID=UPI001BCFC5BB|nr:organic hydroperoxide resistance protein [Mucilaginibacter sp. Bleaf8]MBS7563123.1 organic hydroperoxide resistance protein [Mucilaginibacter sp. Bleaf8]
MEKVYTAVVTAKGGRDGHIQSSDSVVDLDLRKPKEMGGEGGSYTNPEQLFAGAYGACYLGALGSVAKLEGTDVSEATAEVHVSFNKDGNAYALSAELHVHIPGQSLEDTQKLADKAHRACPYSKAVRGNIDVKVVAV